MVKKIMPNLSKNEQKTNKRLKLYKKYAIILVI